MSPKLLGRFIRLPNLLITAFTILLYYFSLISQRLRIITDEAWYILILLIIGALGIMAAGNIYNDMLDYDTDQINRPESLIIGKHVTARQAYLWYRGLTIFNLVTIAFIYGLTESLTVVCIYLFAILSLHGYSQKMKGIIVFGNLVIALLCALVFIIVPVAFNKFLNKEWYKDQELLFTTLLFSLFAFSTTMIRELIKDLEDKIGDKYASIQTIATVWKENHIRIYGRAQFILLSIILITAGTYFFKIQEMGKGIYLSLMIILLMILLHYFNQSESTRQYGLLSKWLKVYILLGLLLMLFWL